MTEDATNSASRLPEGIPVLNSIPLRDNLVETAVKFLQNPKVLTSPLQKKKEFLKKKGLTDEEIEKAITLSGTSGVSDSPHQNIAAVGSTLAATPPKQPVSGWQRLRDYSSLTILVAGVVYGLYSLYKRYIEPMFLHHQKETDEKLNNLEKGITSLNTDVSKSMQELQNTINTLQGQFADQNIKLATVTSNLTDYKENAGGVSSSALSVLQAEVTSIKALLLGAKQFPSTPAIPPVIPSWQMKSRELPSTSEQQVSSGDGSFAMKSDEAVSLHDNGPKQAVTSNSSKPVTKSDLEQDDGDEDVLDASGGSMQDVTVDNSSLESSSGDFTTINGPTDVNDTPVAPASFTEGSSTENTLLNSSSTVTSLSNSATGDSEID